jgi:predicted ribosomally synthesized peptide with nif11-like leader
MSLQSAYKFVEKAYKNEELKDEVQTLESLERVAAFAVDEGYDFTAEELKESALKFYEDHDIELSEEELEAAAGGVVVATFVKAS